MRLVSIGTKIKQLEGMVGTKDLNAKESEFIESVVERTKRGLVTSMLSEKQVEWLESLWTRHFA